MKKLITSALLTSTLLISSSYAEDMKGFVVVSKNIDVKSMTKDELENIFLGKTTIWKDGKRIHIALNADNSEKTEEFFKDYIGKNKRRFKKYWLKLVFAGYGIAPKLFKDSKKAIEYTKSQDSVISFLTTNDLGNLKDVNIVSIDGKESF